MKNIVTLCVFFFLVKAVTGQVIYENFESSKLGESREIKIQLPRGYDEKKDTKYPIFIVLDGDYLFEPVAGDVDYYSYWQDMPDAIVVGVNQIGKRFDDCMYSDANSLPMDNGASFFEFLGLELVPYIERSFRTENFRVIVGHGETANFVNYYLLKPNPIFQGYVVISPDLAPDATTYLTEKLSQIEQKTFYYLSTCENDVPSIKSKVEGLNTNLKAIENKNLFYRFDNFDGPSHYSVPMHAIPRALESIFLVFQPISKKEYQERILKLESSPVDYLLEKYQTIEELFGIKKQILINDFKAIAAAIEKNETFEYYEELSKIARKEYPGTVLSSYYIGRFYEETGEAKKAMKTYQSAYILEEIGGITKDFILEKAEAIKADFGY